MNIPDVLHLRSEKKDGGGGGAGTNRRWWNYHRQLITLL